MSDGCKGGHQGDAFDYVSSDGLVDETCMPYVEQHWKKGIAMPTCPPEVGPEIRTCANSSIKWNAAKCVTPVQSFSLYNGSWDKLMPQSFQNAIMKLGAVATDMLVYNDLLQYKSGVYKHTGNDTVLGGHAIKVVGWGVSNSTDAAKEESYWWVANRCDHQYSHPAECDTPVQLCCVLLFACV